MKYLKLLSVLFLAPVLSSCVGEEPDNIAYVTALGIDRSETGYLYTIQFANPTQISGGTSEGGGSGEQIVENIVVEAPSLYSAMNGANAIVSKDLSMSHSKVIVVSEEAAKEGLMSLVDTVTRNNDKRPDIYIAIAENAENYLEEVKPAIELNPVKYYQLTYESKNGDTIPQNTVFDVYISCISRDRDCFIPLAGVAETDKEEKEKNTGSGGEKSDSNQSSKGSENKSQPDAELQRKGFESGTRNYFAGQAGVKIENDSEALGSAVLRNDRYVGKVGSVETELYNILMSTFNESNITFYAEESPDIPITLQIEEKTFPKYEIDKDKKTVDIYITLESELLSASARHKDKFSIEETERITSEMINEAAEELINKIYKEMNADFLGIKGRLKAKFLTLDDYYDYCENFNCADWNFNVDTKLTVRRTGMTYYH